MSTEDCILDIMRIYNVSREYAQERHRLYMKYKDDIGSDAFLEEYVELHNRFPEDDQKVEEAFAQLRQETIVESLAHKKRASVRYHCTL